MLEFRYRPVAIKGAAPPSLPASATYRLRPFIPVRLVGPGGRSRYFPQVLADTGSVDVVFPWTTAAFIGAVFLPDTTQQLRWQGSVVPLRFAKVQMEIAAPIGTCRWNTIIAFSSAPLRYRLFGIAGGLEFFDATFRGENHVVELSPNGKFPGSMTLAP